MDTAREKQRRWIIPTRMGTSDGIYNTFKVAEDHPHAYGDKKFTDTDKTSEIGSSPRVWGQVLFKGTFRLANRIIPTRMGTSNDNRHNEDKA